MQDVAFELATYQDWIDVVQPKYQGAWNLHNALPDLDFFIMLSSISAVIGNRGQAAYAAANSFLDDFAHYRTSQGLSGTSINLGVVREVGHVADRTLYTLSKISYSDLLLSPETCLGKFCSSDLSRSSLDFLEREMLTPKSLRTGITTKTRITERRCCALQSRRIGFDQIGYPR